MSILLGFVGDFDEVAVAEPEVIGVWFFAVPDGLDVDGEFRDFFGFGIGALDVDVREIGGGTEDVPDRIALKSAGKKGVRGIAGEWEFDAFITDDEFDYSGEALLKAFRKSAAGEIISRFGQSVLAFRDFDEVTKLESNVFGTIESDWSQHGINGDFLWRSSVVGVRAMDYDLSEGGVL